MRSGVYRRRRAGFLVAMLVAMAVGALAGPAAGAAAASVTFAQPQNSGTGSGPRQEVSGDFNGDGKPDLAVTNYGSNTVSVLLGKGDGTFEAAQNSNVGVNPSGITSEDFNEDGKLDLAAMNVGSRTVSVLLGNGDGTFQTAQNFNAGINPFGITSGDFNGDGKPDLAVTNQGLNIVSVLLNKTTFPQPVATDDSYADNANQLLAVPDPGVLANDADPRSQPLTTKLVSGPSHGSFALNSDGSFLYQPNKDFSGTDTFTYKASDGIRGLSSNTATVTITVAPPSSPPVANDDAYSMDQNQTLNVAAPGVLKDDTDPTGKALTASQVRGPSNGTLTLNSDGSSAYTPNQGFRGTDTFTYKASDGASESNVATVAIAVKLVNGGSQPSSQPQPPSKGKHHKKGHHKKGHP